MAGFGEAVLPYLSCTALASTVAFFLCGLQICHRIKTRGSSDGTSPAPFLLAFLSCSLFIQYGLLKDDDIITYTNGIGCFLQACYLIYYYKMTRNQKFLNKVIFTELCIIGLVVFWVQHSTSSHLTKQTYVGNYCIFLNICSVAAPLFDIGKVVRSKSSESLPFPLCVACFVVCLQWMFYGYIVDDIVILVPNVIATVISILQLSLFIIYPGTPKGVLLEKYDHI